MFLKAHNETDTTTVSIEIRLMITMYVVLKIIIIIIGLYGVKLRFLDILLHCNCFYIFQAKATLEKASNQYEMTHHNNRVDFCTDMFLQIEYNDRQLHSLKQHILYVTQSLDCRQLQKPVQHH